MCLRLKSAKVCRPQSSWSSSGSACRARQRSDRLVLCVPCGITLRPLKVSKRLSVRRRRESPLPGRARNGRGKSELRYDFKGVCQLCGGFASLITALRKICDVTLVKFGMLSTAGATVAKPAKGHFCYSPSEVLLQNLCQRSGRRVRVSSSDWACRHLAISP